MSRISVIVGGSGALGSHIVEKFISSGLWKNGIVDFKECQYKSKSFHAGTPLEDLIKNIKEWNQQVDAVVCVAGGFQMGSIKDGDNAVSNMWNMNAKSAFTAAYIASHLLKPDGLLVLTGAQAAFGGGPVGFATGYGMSKAATHQLARDFQSNIMGTKQHVACILPTTIDTPANREAMADADFSKWTKPSTIAEQVFSWSTDPSTRPKELFVPV